MEDKKSIFASYYNDKLGIDDSLEEHKISEKVHQHYNEKYGEDLERISEEIYKEVTIILEREENLLSTKYFDYVHKLYKKEYGEDLEGMVKEIYNDVTIILGREGNSLPTGYAIVGDYKIPTIYFDGDLGEKKLSRWENIHQWEVRIPLRGDSE